MKDKDWHGQGDWHLRRSFLFSMKKWEPDLEKKVSKMEMEAELWMVTMWIRYACQGLG